MRPRRAIVSILVAVCHAGLLIPGTFADTAATYTGSNGNWGTASNWSTNPVVPINSVGENFAVTLGSETVAYNLPGSGQIDSLAMTLGTLNLNAGCNLAVLDGGALNQSNITANNASFSDAESLTNLVSTSFTANNAGNITLSALTAYATNSSASSSFTANGTSSEIGLPMLTTINEGGWSVSLAAGSGGDLEANSLSQLTYSGSVFEHLAISSTGTHSLVDVPLLGSVAQSEMNVSVSSGGTVNWGSPAIIKDSTITLNTSGTLNTSALSNLDSTSVTATNGASMNFPALVTLGTNTLGSVNWTTSAWSASNAGSKLLLPALANITEGGWNVSFTAQSGGDIEVPLLTNVTYSGVVFENLTLSSSGTGSMVDVPMLGSVPHSQLIVSVASGGTVNWGSPKVMEDSSITLNTSGTLNTSALNNLDSTSVTATNGATFSFPSLLTLGTNTLGSVNWTTAAWTASNAGSQILAPNVTAFHENGWNISLIAQSGGYIDLHNVTSITTTGSIFENLTVTSSNAGSEVNLSSLTTTANLANTIDITDNGSVLLGAEAGTEYLTFQAEFMNADGPLAVYADGIPIAVIEPNNVDSLESYQVAFADPLLTAEAIDFVASGSNSSIEVTNYTAVPEPASLLLLLIATPLFSRRSAAGPHRRPRHAFNPPWTIRSTAWMP
jgi:hypothetical protein